MRLPHPNTAGDFQPLAAGTHTAICYRVIDLGTQASTYQGKTTQKHKVMLSWETPDSVRYVGVYPTEKMAWAGIREFMARSGCHHTAI
jgi:hypothetical protein